MIVRSQAAVVVAATALACVSAKPGHVLATHNTEPLVLDTSDYAPVLTVHNIETDVISGTDDAEYDHYIISNIEDESESTVDQSSLIAVEWIPGVGLVDRS
jgi:hypothetical protein